MNFLTRKSAPIRSDSHISITGPDKTQSDFLFPLDFCFIFAVRDWKTFKHNTIGHLWGRNSSPSSRLAVRSPVLPLFLFLLHAKDPWGQHTHIKMSGKRQQQQSNTKQHSQLNNLNTKQEPQLNNSNTVIERACPGVIIKCTAGRIRRLVTYIPQSVCVCVCVCVCVRACVRLFVRMQVNFQCTLSYTPMCNHMH